MLTHLSVRNFAVLEAAAIDFGPGLTVVTGETGAGKSLLVDALLLLAGARADTGMVRAGSERAELEAEFDLANSADARAWLAAQALDEPDGACRIRRVIAAEGGSRAWINGRAVALAQLADLTAPLLEIHGQHEHHALLERPRQLTMLDAFGHHAAALARVRELAQQFHTIVERERALSGGDDRDARIALLRHEVAELDQWALAPAALAELEAQHKRLANAGKLAEGSAALADALDGDGERTVASTLGHAHTELERLAELDPALQSPLELLGAAGIQVREAAGTLARYAQGLELDPDRYAELDTHLAALHDLARRHHLPVAELPGHAARLRSELAALEDAGEELARLGAEHKQCFAAYGIATAALSKLRTKAAAQLGTAVTALMAELGMAGGTFAVDLQPQYSGEPDPQGRERCEFTVSANPGMPLRPLRKVASGGELSRIGLAIEVAAMGSDAVGTMVFDEVDAGIGGGVAEVVGVKLRALAGQCQVLCVTHLPQVAAQGHAHLAVSKTAEGDSATRTHIAVLDAAGRRAELARMLGGVEIDAETRAHAKRMLEKAQAP